MHLIHVFVVVSSFSWWLCFLYRLLTCLWAFICSTQHSHPHRGLCFINSIIIIVYLFSCVCLATYTWKITNKWNVCLCILIDERETSRWKWCPSYCTQLWVFLTPVSVALDAGNWWQIFTIKVDIPLEWLIFFAFALAWRLYWLDLKKWLTKVYNMHCHKNSYRICVITGVKWWILSQWLQYCFLVDKGECRFLFKVHTFPVVVSS